MIKLSELQMKEIITVSNGKRLGYIDDLEIDADRGKILSLIIFVKENDRFFGRQEEVFIPWNQIVTIGNDVILVQEIDYPRLYPEENSISKN